MKSSTILMLCFLAAVCIAKENNVSKCEEAGAKPYVYKTVDSRELKLYVTSPEGHKAGDSTPAIVFFHGGGWTSGAPGQFTEHAKYLASRGMVCVQVQYRLLVDKKATPEVCIADAKSAMRWVRSHATELGIDPKRIAAGGGSAGGHLAAATATIEGCNDKGDDLSVDPKPQALVLFNPVYNNGPDGGWGYARTGERYRDFSPGHNIRKGMPPAIVCFGSNDSTTAGGIAEKFRDDMKAVGSRSELTIYEGQNHGFFNYDRNGGRWFRLTMLEADKFLASLGYLKGEPTIKLEPGDKE